MSNDVLSQKLLTKRARHETKVIKAAQTYPVIEKLIEIS